MPQRGLTARPGICAIVYTQSILPCSTRLWHKGLRMVVGQKEGSSTRALVLVSNSGKRRYTLLPSLLLGERPLPPTQKPVRGPCVNRVQRLYSCAPPGNNAYRGPYFGPGGGEHG